MRRPRVLLAAAAAVSLTAGGTALAATTSPAAGPAAVPLRSVPGAGALDVPGAVDLGAAPSQPTQVVLDLALRDQAGLDALLASGQIVSPAQFTGRFSPAQATVDAVSAWARGAGLTVSSVSANRTLVSLAGSTAAVDRAFGVASHLYKAPTGVTYRAVSGTASVPAAVASQLTAVLGLSDAGRVGPAARSGSRLLKSSYGPQDLAALYDAPASATGSGEKVAVIAAGDLTQPRKDLVTFESKFGLPQVPWTQVTVGAPSADTSGDDEWDLDTQYSTGLAPSVSGLTVYVGNSLSNADILATVNRWVSDGGIKQASFSAGECEVLAAVTGFTASLDQTLKQATAQGQTLFTSSGDTGSFCPVGPAAVNGVPAGVPGVNYPAASPYAIGVGGTTVVGAFGALTNEVAWYAGGGGNAYTEPVPAFQAAAGGSFLGVRRGVPDVALDADPTTGYTVIVNGQPTTIGGTSASAPAWQGIWARAQAARGGALGFAGPRLYRAPAGAFHDITVGFQGLYAATPGYDYTTGRGTPDVAKLIPAL